MLLTDHLSFAAGIGWLVALTMAVVVRSLPGGFAGRSVGWLFAFCAAQILASVLALTAVRTAAPGAADFALDTWQPILAIASGMALWEFARRIWNEQGRRRIPASFHLIGIESAAVFAATGLALRGVATPSSVPPIAMLAAVVPGVLGVAAVLLLWHCLGRDDNTARRAALRTAALGLGVFGLGEIPGFALGDAVPPWIAVGGFAFAGVALPAARTRTTLMFALGLVLAVIGAPLATGLYVENITALQQRHLHTRGTAAAAVFQGRAAAALASAMPDADTLRAVQQQLQTLRTADALLRDATLWKLSGNTVRKLTPGTATAVGFDNPRPATAIETASVARSRSFIVPPADASGDRGVIVVNVPLRPAAFETPAAWLALEYPDALWAAERASARRGGLAFCGLVAAFCAIGFVFAVRHALENAQQLAVERALSADKAKTEFLAFLSHEMRTPLQTILGRTELLRSDGSANAAAHRHAAAIETQGRLLLRLVTDLLDLGTLEAGKFRLCHEPFSLRQALAAVEDTIRPAAAARNLGFTTEISGDVPDRVIGDEARLRQILGNLLGNAVKYTERGEVRLRVTGEDPAVTPDGHQRLTFVVTDSGPGLPPDKLPQLFTLFTRLNSGTTFTRDGTGVGLALVRRLCELMGGRVTAANRPDGGAEFTVQLAFEVDPAPGPARIRDVTTSAGGGLNILVAEDNAAAREFLVEALATLGHHAVAVADGSAALDAATSRRFDAVVLDVNLPVRDGISVAQALARRAERPRLVGCSAEAFAQTRDAALAAGMDVWLEKPVTIQALAAALTPAVPVPETATLFERLRSPEIVADARKRLTGEIPTTVAQLRAARRAGDATALRRRAHTLHSTALLANEPAIAELCRRLELVADGCDDSEIDALIDQLEQPG